MKETQFKNTELGSIPVDWEIKTWGEVLNTFRSGSTPSRSNPEYWKNGTVKWVTSGELDYNLIEDTAEHITTQGVIKTNLIVHKPGTFLMAMTGMEAEGTRGRCAILATEATTNQSCLAIKGSEKLNIGYLFRFYQVWGNDFSFRFSQGSKQQSFTADIVRRLPIVVPPIKEQEKIAEALSDVDALIAELGELIEKKRLVKQGAMQQLLTAKRRLPGFSKPWLEKELGKIGITYSGLSGKTKEDFGVGDARYITFLNVLTNPKIRTDLFESVRVGIEEKQNRVEKGDLFFNTSSETPDEVGICSYLDESVSDLYLNSFCFGYRISDPNVFPLYLAYFFRSKIGRDLMSIMAQGVTRYNISKSAFNKASIFIPSDIAEQRAIADMLTDMDNEIAQLEAKREKYRAIKEGMMQQLLTGRIRLIDPTTSSNSTTSVASSNSPDPAPHAPVITYEPTTAYPHSLAAEPKISE